MALSRSIRRRLRRLAEVGPARRALMLEAVVCLVLARLGLIVVPFPKLARRLGHFVPPCDPRVSAARERGPQAALAVEIGWAVTRAARYLPFKAVCLPQAMAAQMMLRRRGVASVMHFGAARGEEKPLDAHAWLDAAGVEVTGYPVGPKFAEIACFV
ncbi:MAG TPA: lasso peptide biosynthesis B2 protein [Pseudolabrys sp.]|nr:lasso peptide biosynthesis B2 protein [Pseudolabrys sp.]